jgi:hypothetical protein
VASAGPVAVVAVPTASLTIHASVGASYLRARCERQQTSFVNVDMRPAPATPASQQPHLNHSTNTNDYSEFEHQQQQQTLVHRGWSRVDQSATAIGIHNIGFMINGIHDNDIHDNGFTIKVS